MTYEAVSSRKRDNEPGRQLSPEQAAAAAMVLPPGYAPGRSPWGTRRCPAGSGSTRPGWVMGGQVAVIGMSPWKAAQCPRVPCGRPRANCFAERFVLTLRTEVTDRMLIFGEQHLRRVLATYAAHYNTQRPHRALHLRPPRPESPVPKPILGRIRRRPVLGGLINPYEPAA